VSQVQKKLEGSKWALFGGRFPGFGTFLGSRTRFALIANHRGGSAVKMGILPAAIPVAVFR
jgi:hypothetical protein